MTSASLCSFSLTVCGFSQRRHPRAPTRDFHCTARHCALTSARWAPCQGLQAAEEAAGFQAGHPIRKQEVGRRLALNARAMIYGEVALAKTREGPIVVNCTVHTHGDGVGVGGGSVAVTLRFDAASAVGLHLAGTAPCCTATTAPAACATCCTNATSSPVTFSDPDAGSLLAPASKVFAADVVQ